MYEITLDVQKGGFQAVLEGFRVGDANARELCVRLCEGRSPYKLPVKTDEKGKSVPDYIATLFIKGRSAVHYSTCTAHTDRVEHVFLSEEIEVGVSECEIKIIGGGKVLTSAKFKIVATDVLQDDDAIEAENTFSALSDALERVLSAEGSAAEAVRTAEEAVNTAEDAKEAAERAAATADAAKKTADEAKNAIDCKADRSELGDQIRVITLQWYENPTQEQQKEEIEKFQLLEAEHEKDSSLSGLLLRIQYGSGVYPCNVIVIAGPAIRVEAVRDNIYNPEILRIGFHDSDDEEFREVYYGKFPCANRTLNESSDTEVPSSKAVADWVRTGYVSKEDGDLSDVTNKVEAMEKVLAELTHEHIKITRFTLSTYKAEIGAEVQVLISVEVDRVPKSVKLTRGSSIIPFVLTGTFGEAIVSNITSNTTFKLVVIDDMDHEITKSDSINFYNGIYMGVGGEDIADIEIGDLRKELKGNRQTTFTVNVGEGQYIWYACPTSYGVPSFVDTGTGFATSMEKKGEIDYTNKTPQKHVERYQVWRSVRSGLGNITVEVK